MVVVGNKSRQRPWLIVKAMEEFTGNVQLRLIHVLSNYKSCLYPYGTTFTTHPPRFEVQYDCEFPRSKQ
jgi:hypothetical protein